MQFYLLYEGLIYYHMNFSLPYEELIYDMHFSLRYKGLTYHMDLSLPYKGLFYYNIHFSCLIKD